MQTTIETFDDRVNEIKLYYDAIEELYVYKDGEYKNKKYFNNDFLKILKSNALLMIYNLVESAIMGGILEIYDELQQQGVTYCQVRAEIQEIWFSYKFNQVYDKNAHYNSYRDKAAEIISKILCNEILVLDRKATDISGNLDANKIRQICKEHGIVVHIPENCRGGEVLNDVKEKRNCLAHGTISFVECGRDYTINDLRKIKEETVIFLKGILDSMKNYYDQQMYLNTYCKN